MTSKNPLIFLTAMLWRYSEGNRFYLTLYLLMSVVAVAISSLEPLVVAQLLNSIQNGSYATNTSHIFILLGALVAIDLGYKFFQGIVSVIQVSNSYKAYINFKSYMLDDIKEHPDFKSLWERYTEANNTSA